jgi:hypothetical protein
MICQSFVLLYCRYKASNEGSFPTATLVNKELGGSYYVTREVVQKLKYEHKLAQVGQSNLALPVDLKESSSDTSTKSIEEKAAATVGVTKKDSTKRGQRSMISGADGVKKEEFSGKAADVFLHEQGCVMASTKVKMPTETSCNTTNNMVQVCLSYKWGTFEQISFGIVVLGANDLYNNLSCL